MPKKSPCTLPMANRPGIGSSSAVSTWESAFTWRPKGMVSVEHTFFVA